MNIGIDLDGVLYDFAGSLRRYMEWAGYDVSRCGPTRVWKFYEDWGLDLDTFLRLCHEGVTAGFVFSGPARDGSIYAMRRLKADGHTLHIITDRQFGLNGPYESELATRIWLHTHRIPYDTLTFSADKTVVPTDVFIEDKIENYDALEAAGSRPYLVTRAWNLPAGDGRRRVASVIDFTHLIVHPEYQEIAA